MKEKILWFINVNNILQFDCVLDGSTCMGQDNRPTCYKFLHASTSKINQMLKYQVSRRISIIQVIPTFIFLNLKIYNTDNILWRFLTYHVISYQAQMWPSRLTSARHFCCLKLFLLRSSHWRTSRNLVPHKLSKTLLTLIKNNFLHSSSSPVCCCITNIVSVIWVQIIHCALFRYFHLQLALSETESNLGVVYAITLFIFNMIGYCFWRGFVNWMAYVVTLNQCFLIWLL